MNQTETKKTCTEQFLADLYKNMKMGADSIINLMPKVKGSDLRDEMTAQLNRYEALSGEIGDLIYDCGETPKEENVMTKMMSKVGMAMNTMMDATDSHIAQMMIEGAKLERLGRGDVGEVVEERNGGDATPAVTFYMPDNGRDKHDEEE